MKGQILAYLKEEMPEIDFETPKKLWDDGVLDSISLTNLIGLLSMEYGIEIPYEEIIEDNFNSLDGIVGLVERLM